MKKIINIFVALFALATFACCGEKGPELSSTHNLMLGSWHLVEWFGNEADQNFKPVEDNTLQNPVDMIDVWIRFNANGTFDLFQKGMPNIYYSHYAGTCKVEAELLSGVYEDGKDFGATYSVKLSEDNNTLTLTNINSTDDVCVYERMDIPSKVIDGVRASSTRGEEGDSIKRFL
jgi:hypothetical protein